MQQISCQFIEGFFEMLHRKSKMIPSWWCNRKSHQIVRVTRRTLRGGYFRFIHLVLNRICRFSVPYINYWQPLLYILTLQECGSTSEPTNYWPLLHEFPSPLLLFSSCSHFSPLAINSFFSSSFRCHRSSLVPLLSLLYLFLFFKTLYFSF